MDKRRNAGPGRYGAHPVHLVCDGGTLTANTTTVFRVATPPGKFVFSRFSASAQVVPADADGTLLATVRKYDASADAEVTVSASIDLEALTANERSTAGVSTSATEAQLLLDTGDTLDIAVVNNSAAIDTQATALRFAVELLQLD